MFATFDDSIFSHSSDMSGLQAIYKSSLRWATVATIDMGRKEGNCCALSRGGNCVHV